MDHQLPQSFVKYTVPSPKSDALCGNCYFYGGEGHCHVVKSDPLPIVAPGWCDMHRPIEDVKEELDDMIADVVEEIIEVAQDVAAEAAAVEVDMNELSEQKSNGRTRLTEAINSVKQWFGLTDNAAFKALGNGYWCAAYTNNFEDLERQTLSEKAHDRYLMRVEQKLVDLPELQLWHHGAARIGKALDVYRLGHVMMAFGKFDDNEAGRAAEKHFLSTRKAYKLSQGFLYPRWALKDGVYHDYNTFEITILPDGKEANPFTSFEAMKEFNVMPVSEEKKTFWREILPPHVADQVIKRSEKWEEAGKELEKMGVAFKDFADLDPAPAAAPEATTALFTDLVNDMGTMSDQLVVQGKALERVITEHKADRDTWAKDRATLESTIKELRGELALAPRGADSGQAVEDKTAADELDKRQKDVAYDPAFPGMGVPAKSAQQED